MKMTCRPSTIEPKKASDHHARTIFMQKIARITQTFLASSIFAVCAAHESVANEPVAADQIKDSMTAEEFRDYGKTSPAKISTRIGDLEFTEGGFAGGYPTLGTVKVLRDELDFQRATQAYIWAMPLVSYGEWLRVHEQTFKAGDGDIVLYKTPQAKQGILTANVTTPYAISFADLTRTGPLVFEVPAGLSGLIKTNTGSSGITPILPSSASVHCSQTRPKRMPCCASLISTPIASAIADNEASLLKWVMILLGGSGSHMAWLTGSP
jgi:hypothetical protein